MSLTRVTSFSISLDGFGTGEPQTRETPFGHAGDRLHEWMFATRWWRGADEPGGSQSSSSTAEAMRHRGDVHVIRWLLET